MIKESNDRKNTLQYLKLVYENINENGVMATGIIICITVTTIVSYYLPKLSQQIMDVGLAEMNRQIIIRDIAAIFLLIMINSSLLYLQDVMRAKLSAGINRKMLNEMFSQMLNVDDSYYRGRSFTELYDQIHTDVEILVGGIGGLPILIIGELATIAGGILGLMSINIKMTLAIIIFFVPCQYLLISLLSRTRKQMILSYIKCNSKMAGWMDDAISGINEIKIYGLSRIVRKEFWVRQNELINKAAAIDIHESLASNISNILLGIITVSTYAIGSYYYLREMMSLGSIVAFLSYTDYVLSPISTLIGIKYNIATIIPSYSRYRELYAFEKENEGEIDVPEKKGIVFTGVSASYEQTMVLKNATFSINEGEITVLLGINGSGKSTILKLLLRFVTPLEGTIRLGGIDINDVKLEGYRMLFSYVAQIPFIFNDTIRENIRLGSKISDSSLMKIIEEIAGEKFIEEHSLNEVVGDGGAFLSGGERQLIAFVRAVIQDKDIIVLDEPTANLDSTRKAAVIEKIKKLRDSGKTVITATHDDDLVNIADKIFCVENGIVS